MFLSVGVSFGSSLVKSVSKFPTSVLDRCREQNKRHVNMERAFFNIMAREEPSGPFLELSIPRAIQGLNRERGGPLRSAGKGDFRQWV